MEWSSATRVELALVLAPPFVYTLAFIPLTKYLAKKHNRTIIACRLGHNVLMAAFSCVMTVMAVIELSARPLSLHGQLCAPAGKAPLMVAAWYLSKFWEWFDSALLVAQGKPLGSLHLNHHASTATVVASHFIGRGGGTLFAARTSIFDWPLLLNGAVHSLMYSYYAAPKTLKPLRKLITSAQICQHVLVLLAILYTSITHHAVGGSCDISPMANGISLILYLMYLVQFLSFYVSAYLGKKVRGAQSARLEQTSELVARELVDAKAAKAA